MITEPAVSAALATALERWRLLVGADHVLTDPTILRSYQADTTPTTRTILAIVRPGTVAQIQDIVRIASAQQIPLYPISTGRNWGYGAAQPVRDGHVILELSRMRSIEVNRQLAYAVIEPGVTQAQLAEHLATQGIPLWIDPTGAGPSTSVLGNALERGYGLTPYGDHFAQVCGMEVVLADGQVLRTGFWQWPQAKAAHVHRWGVGPYLDGLFTQSNMGIVTRIGLWLMPKPERVEVCFFRAASEEALGPLVEVLRPLLLQRTLTGAVNLVHRNRVLTMLRQYPWDRMEGRTPLSQNIAEALARQYRLGAWNGVTALYGTRAQVQASKRMLRHALRGAADRVAFLSEDALQYLERWPWLCSRLTGLQADEALKVLRSSVGILTGQPSQRSLATAFWRSKRPLPTGTINPAQAGGGLIWYSPVVPMTASDVLAFRALIEPIFSRHQFECCPTFTSVTARALDCTLPILYNRDDADDATRAAACYQELLETCARHGYLPYRLGIQSMEWLTSQPSVFWDVVARLKRALDPANILSQGRYAP